MLLCCYEAGMGEVETSVAGAETETDAGADVGAEIGAETGAGVETGAGADKVSADGAVAVGVVVAVGAGEVVVEVEVSGVVVVGAEITLEVTSFVSIVTFVRGLVESRGDVEEVIGVRLKVLGSDIADCEVVDSDVEMLVVVSCELFVDEVAIAFQKVELNKFATDPSLPTTATCKLGIITNSLALLATPKTCTISPSASVTFGVKPRAALPFSINGADVLGCVLSVGGCELAFANAST